MILLRTLTLKSTFDVGRYENQTVEKVMHVRDGKQYLSYLYYNYEKITFTDDVLKELNILKKHRIKKPGVSKEIWELHKKSINERWNNIDKKVRSERPAIENIKRASLIKSLRKKSKNASNKRISVRGKHFESKEYNLTLNRSRYKF